VTLPQDIYPKVMRVIDLLGEGRTESEACDTAGVTVSTFRNYVSKTPELHDLFLDAEQRGYDRLADELINIHSVCDQLGVTDAKMVKILSDNRKWLLSKRRPQQYGDKVVHEHNITADRTIIEALSQGKQRALEANAATVVNGVIDATYTVVINGVEVDPEIAEFVS
jgi:hypothetical protein